MKKKELVEIIRLVVKSEVKKAVKTALNEVKKQSEAPISLTEALSQTKDSGDWKSMGTLIVRMLELHLLQCKMEDLTLE
jgi:hypothetical protein